MFKNKISYYQILYFAFPNFGSLKKIIFYFEILSIFTENLISVEAVKVLWYLVAQAKLWVDDEIESLKFSYGIAVVGAGGVEKQRQSVRAWVDDHSDNLH